MSHISMAVAVAVVELVAEVLIVIESSRTAVVAVVAKFVHFELVTRRVNKSN